MQYGFMLLHRLMPYIYLASGYIVCLSRHNICRVLGEHGYQGRSGKAENEKVVSKNLRRVTGREHIVLSQTCSNEKQLRTAACMV